MNWGVSACLDRSRSTIKDPKEPNIGRSQDRQPSSGGCCPLSVGAAIRQFSLSFGCHLAAPTTLNPMMRKEVNI